MSKKSTRDPTAEKYLRPQEVADLIGVHKRSVWRWLKAKKLPGCKIGRSWIISRVQLDKFINDRIDARMSRGE